MKGSGLLSGILKYRSKRKTLSGLTGSTRFRTIVGRWVCAGVPGVRHRRPRRFKGGKLILVGEKTRRTHGRTPDWWSCTAKFSTMVRSRPSPDATSSVRASAFLLWECCCNSMGGARVPCSQNRKFRVVSFFALQHNPLPPSSRQSRPTHIMMEQHFAMSLPSTKTSSPMCGS